MKVITMYLPQFHRVKENDEWWGEGYTEWTAVKSAKKYFDDQIQPRIPLNENYYDLMDKKTMEWQAGLMKEYGVYGQSFYHYYFENGRKILEKPAENLLKWKDINMPFCFTWANESWARTWSKLGNSNAWNTLKEGKVTGRGELLKQNYGTESDWINHFEYLLQFFLDDRYIKKGNKPVFIIYKPDDIGCLVQMIDCWDELAKKHGFAGMYFVGINSSQTCFDAYLKLEANNVGGYLPKIVDYKDVSRQIIANASTAEDNTFFCGNPSYDDTPRRGENGSYFYNSTPEIFREQIKYLTHISRARGNEFLFINAWNEWGEGMILEPDVQFEHRYLEALRDGAKEGKDLSDSDIKLLASIVNEANIIRIKKEEKRLAYVVKRTKIFEKILYSEENNDTITSRLLRIGYRKIAIYGLGVVGKHVASILANSEVEIVYGIDKNAKNLNYPFPVYKLDDKLPKADAVIVTADNYDYACLKEKGVDFITLQSLLE